MTSPLQLTRQHANAIIQGCFDKSRALGLRPLAAAVLDAGGHLISVQREDSAASLVPKIAIAKASGALALGVSSRQLGLMAANSPAFVASVGPLSPEGIVAAAGGVLIRDANGTLLGAIGAAGDLPDNDEACALAGITVAGLDVPGR